MSFKFRCQNHVSAAHLESRMIGQHSTPAMPCYHNFEQAGIRLKFPGLRKCDFDASETQFLVFCCRRLQLKIGSGAEGAAALGRNPLPNSRPRSAARAALQVEPRGQTRKQTQRFCVARSPLPPVLLPPVERRALQRHASGLDSTAPARAQRGSDPPIPRAKLVAARGLGSELAASTRSQLKPERVLALDKRGRKRDSTDWAYRRRIGGGAEGARKV
ncbi:hypothetical protein B0H15DRAFT_806354 [Mycena belliarum]|uniref:Uncharacterized protein n=1 Tax=Mycena belliarum TaxID=1033014 RepID=A0AAD6TSD5_9AGAR|nr:hypothetical protein B0H15DRAFT_806354 [Mycena belliae]